MTLQDILSRLKEPFPAADHVERDVPGGKTTWFYIPWQKIRDRLNEVCPDWQVEYGLPTYLDKYCVVSCTLTLCGISRQALGNAEIELLSRSGKDMARGTPIERAVADAFKNAAEAFGIGAYLDEQSQDKRLFTIRYLQSQGDGRGLKTAAKNGWIDSSLHPEKQAELRQNQAQTEVTTIRQKADSRPITDGQVKRFQAIARQQGGYTTAGAKKLLETYQFASSKDITVGVYDDLCQKAADISLAANYNQAAAQAS